VVVDVELVLVVVDTVEVLELVELEVDDVEVLELVELEVVDVVGGAVVVTIVVVGRLVEVVDVVGREVEVVDDVVVVVTGHDTPQQGRFMFWITVAVGDTGAGDHRRGRSPVELVLGGRRHRPETVSCVLAARNVAPEGAAAGAGRDERARRQQVELAAFDVDRAAERRRAVHGIDRVAVRSRAPIVMRAVGQYGDVAGERVARQVDLAGERDVPTASNENSSLCPKPLLVPNIGPDALIVVPAVMSTLPPSPSTESPSTAVSKRPAPFSSTRPLMVTEPFALTRTSPPVPPSRQPPAPHASSAAEPFARMLPTRLMLPPALALKKPPSPMPDARMSTTPCRSS
jgi:hypothetical protein